MPDRCQLLQQINEISFVVNDLNLYLDTTHRRQGIGRVQPGHGTEKTASGFLCQGI